jgi:hypothetical protein
LRKGFCRKWIISPKNVPDLGSGKRIILDPDPEGKKPPDPGFGSAKPGNLFMPRRSSYFSQTYTNIVVQLTRIRIQCLIEEI